MKISMKLAVAAFALAAAVPAWSAQSGAAQAFQDLFKQSQEGKRGLTFYVKGQAIPGIVTSVGGDTVEVRNQTHGRIVIRIESIDAVAQN